MRRRICDQDIPTARISERITSTTQVMSPCESRLSHFWSTSNQTKQPNRAAPEDNTQPTHGHKRGANKYDPADQQDDAHNGHDRVKSLTPGRGPVEVTPLRGVVGAQHQRQREYPAAEKTACIEFRRHLRLSLVIMCRAPATPTRYKRYPADQAARKALTIVVSSASDM